MEWELQVLTHWISVIQLFFKCFEFSAFKPFSNLKLSASVAWSYKCQVLCPFDLVTTFLQLFPLHENDIFLFWFYRIVWRSGVNTPFPWAALYESLIWLSIKMNLFPNTVKLKLRLQTEMFHKIRGKFSSSKIFLLLSLDDVSINFLESWCWLQIFSIPLFRFLFTPVAQAAQPTSSSSTWYDQYKISISIEDNLNVKAGLTYLVS